MKSYMLSSVSLVVVTSLALGSSVAFGAPPPLPTNLPKPAAPVMPVPVKPTGAAPKPAAVGGSLAGRGVPPGRSPVAMVRSGRTPVTSNSRPIRSGPKPVGSTGGKTSALGGAGSGTRSGNGVQPQRSSGSSKTGTGSSKTGAETVGRGNPAGADANGRAGARLGNTLPVGAIGTGVAVGIGATSIGATSNGAKTGGLAASSTTTNKPAAALLAGNHDDLTLPKKLSPTVAVTGATGSGKALESAGKLVLASAGVGLAGISPAPVATVPAITKGASMTSQVALKAVVPAGQAAVGPALIANATSPKPANVTVVNVGGSVVGGSVTVPPPTPTATVQFTNFTTLPYTAAPLMVKDPMAAVRKPSTTPLPTTIAYTTSSTGIVIGSGANTQLISFSQLSAAGVPSNGKLISGTPAQVTAAVENILTTQYASLPPKQLEQMIAKRNPTDPAYAVLSNLVSLSGYVATAQKAYGSMSTSDLQAALANVKATTDNGIAQGILVAKYEAQYTANPSLYQQSNTASMTKEQTFAFNAVYPPPQFQPMPVVTNWSPPSNKPKNDVFCGGGINLGCLFAGLDNTNAPPALYFATTIVTTTVLGGALAIAAGGIAAGAVSTELAMLAPNVGVVVLGAGVTTPASSGLLPGFIAAAALIPISGASGAAGFAGAGAVMGYLNGA